MSHPAKRVALVPGATHLLHFDIIDLKPPYPGDLTPDQHTGISGERAAMSRSVFLDHDEVLIGYPHVPGLRVFTFLF